MNKFNIIIFDFDQTLCNIDINSTNIIEYIDNDQNIIVNGSKYHISVLFNDYYKLLDILVNLKQNNVKLCIASYGKLTLITKVLNSAFPDIFDYILTTDNISQESGTDVQIKGRCIIESECTRNYGKNIMIITIMNKFHETNPKKVLFFDDDKNNLYCAVKQLQIVGFNNDIHGITPTIIQKMLKYKYINYKK